MLSGGESRSGKFPKTQARVVELVVTAHSKCAAERRVGSNPTLGTTKYGFLVKRDYANLNRVGGVGLNPTKPTRLMKDDCSN